MKPRLLTPSPTRQDLLKELIAIQSVVERKTTKSILSNFFVEARDSPEGGLLNITATDLDQAIRTSAKARSRKAAVAPYLPASHALRKEDSTLSHETM